MTEALLRWEAGIVLAWLALPFLVWVASRERDAEPASRHRALIAALALSASLFALPWARGLFEARFAGSAPGWGSFFHGGTLAATAASRWAGAPARAASLVLPCIGATWALLVLLRSAALAARLARVRALLARAHDASAPLQRTMERAAGAASVLAPRLLVSEETKVPFTAGILRSVVVLPRYLADSADSETVDLVLRHELGHVARRDVPIDAAVTLLLVAFAGHPSARSLARNIRLAREEAVDAAIAPEAPRAYASLLVAMAERVCGVEHLEVSMDDTDLAARVRRILEGPGRRRPARMAPMALAFALFACSGAVVSPTQRDPDAVSSGQLTLRDEFSVRMIARGPSADGTDPLSLGERVLRKEDIRAARVEQDEATASPRIQLDLTPAGAASVERATAANIGGHMAILVGDRVVAAPAIRVPITGGRCEISTQSDADFEVLARAVGLP